MWKLILKTFCNDLQHKVLLIAWGEENPSSSSVIISNTLKKIQSKVY